MNKASTRGFKLTTVAIAVLVLGVSAVFSGNASANDTVAQVELRK